MSSPIPTFASESTDPGRRSPRAAFVAALLVIAACGGGDGGPAAPEEATATVTVQVATTGEDIDADGYTVRLGSRTLPVQSDGTVTFSDVALGSQQVTLEGVAANCTVAGGTARTTSVTSSGAQVAFSVVCAISVNDGFATIACPAVQLAATAAAPLELVPIGTLPAAMAEPRWARITYREGNEAAPTLLEARADGSATLVVPPHPTGAAGGGEVIVRFTDGGQACPALRFQVDPLPPAAGEFAGVVDELQDLLAVQAAALGTTLGELDTQNPAQLPEYLYPLAVAHSVIMGTGPETSLRELADGGLDAETAALLDAVLARVGLRQELAAERASLTAPGGGLRGQPLAGAVTLPCTSIGLGDVLELDECMRAALSAKFKQTGATATVLNDLGNAFTVLGFIPTPLTKAVSAIAGVVIWLRQVSLEGAAQILPSRFTRLAFDYDDYFQEDEELTGEWRNARVWATSEGWRMDKTILDAVFQFVNARGGSFGDVASRAGFPSGSIESDAASYVLTQVVQSLINNTAGSGFVEVPARESGPVDVTSLPWTQSAIVAGTSVVLTSRRSYEPVEPGTSLLSVKTLDPVNGEFGFQQVPPPGEPVEIRVDQLDLDITPADTTLAPGEGATFYVDVSKSAHPEMVEIDPDVDIQGMAAIQYEGLNRHRITYLAPQDPDFTRADLLTARHTATTGARENGEPRVAIATVRFGSLTISPRSACLQPAQQQAFTAEVVGPSDQAVIWEAETGSIDAAGTYTAPGTPPASGSVMIRARSVAYPALRDSVTVQVGSCSCDYTLQVGTSLVEGRAGDVLSFTDIPPLAGGMHQLITIHLRDEAASAETTMAIRGSSVDDFPLTGPATLPVGVGGGVGGFFYGSGEQVPTLLLEAYTPMKQVRGSVSGQVEPLGQTGTLVPFQASFTITIPDDYVAIGARYSCTVGG